MSDDNAPGLRWHLLGLRGRLHDKRTALQRELEVVERDIKTLDAANVALMKGEKHDN